MASRYAGLSAPIRIVGAQLVCAHCRVVMTNVTINALPMDCPCCEYTLITQGEPFEAFNPDDQNEEPVVEDDATTHPDRRQDRRVLDGEVVHEDCTCGDCMDAAFEEGR